MEFRKQVRDPKLLLDEWRLASVEEVESNLKKIKSEGILESWDIARLLDGWVDGPGYRYNIGNEYKSGIGHMLLVKIPVSAPSDDSFPRRNLYSQLKLNDEGRKAALLLSCEDKITEVMCFVLESIRDSFEEPDKRQRELDCLTGSLKETFHHDRTIVHYAADQPHNKKEALYVAWLVLREFDYGKELIKAADKYKRTALHLAALHGNIDLCRFLMEEAKLKVEERDRNGENVLHFAVQSNGVDFVLKDCGQSLVFSRDAKGRTALHKAAADGDVQMIKVLLDQIDQRSPDYISYIRQADLLEQSALLVALSGGHIGAVEHLLHQGSSPLAERNSDGKTALHYAVQLSEEKQPVEVARLLLKACRSDEERSLLLWASATGIGTAEESAESSSAVKNYLKNERERTKECSKDLLRSALELKHDDMAWELINRGANTDCINSDPSNPCFKNFLKRIKTMPERGRDQPTTDDSLGRKAFAEGLAALLLNPYVKTPVTVGISGDWGMGKSSLMMQTEMILLKAAAQLAFPNLLPTEKFPGSKEFELTRKGRRKYRRINEAARDLLPLEEAAHPYPLLYLLDNYQDKHYEVYRSLAVMDRSEMFHVKGGTLDSSSSNQYSLGKIPSILAVRYNAWHYKNESEAWAGLAVSITQVIEETMTRAQRIRCRWRYAWREQKDKILFELFLPCLLALFLSGWLSWAVWTLVSRSKQKEVVNLKYGSIPVTVLVVVWTVMKQLLSVLKPISVQIMGYVRIPDHTKNLGYQHQVISDINFLKDQMGEKASWLWKFMAFEWLWRLFGLYPDTVHNTSVPKSPPPCKDDVRIIVFVDDLDRCHDTVILQVLSAVNLVLAACEINVILGMDKNMIARAIANKFQDIHNQEMVDPVDLAEKYISKIVQLPLALPDPEYAETKKFLQKQLGSGGSDVEHESSTPTPSPEAADTVVSVTVDEDTNSNARKQLGAEGSFGDRKSSQASGFWSKILGFFKLPGTSTNGCWRYGLEENLPKLQSTPLNSQMMMPSYSSGEQDAIDYLSKLTTDTQKLPREWKRFLTYHRLAWNILSQRDQVKILLGWQVQLLVWIFCCWEWRNQINVVIKNWKKLVSVNSLSSCDDEPSLKNIVDNYIDEQEKKKKEESREKRKEKINEEEIREKRKEKINEEEVKEEEGISEKKEKEKEKEEENEKKIKEREDWNALKETLTQYDVSVKCILSFQKFRFHCEIGYLPDISKTK